MSTYTTISFPGLGLEMDPSRYLEIGPLKIYFYGIIIALGLILAVIYGWKRCNQFGIREDLITDGVLLIVPFAIICARAYYCIFKWDAEFAADPISVLYIWNGGLAIYGGVIGAIIGVAVYCLVRKINLPALLDLVALGFLIGQCVGRWGNFFNREAFGEETDFFLRMGLKNGFTGVVTYHHPTFLYESLWNLTGFILLHFLSKKRQYNGQIALGYVAWYGLGRAFIEGLRTDSLYWGSFRVSQLLAAASCLLAVIVLVVMMFVPKERYKLVAPITKADKDEETEAEESSEEEAEETSEEEEAPSEEEPSEEASSEEESEE